MCSPAYSQGLQSVDPLVTTPSGYQSPDPAQQSAQQDYPGFPTYAQYKDLEAAHLANLSSIARQEKSLMPQALFDRIWDELVAPAESTEDSQFRFWVRKLFTLGPPPPCSGFPESDVALLYKGFLVAIREQLYQLLCSFHGEAEHGGRDRTIELIYENYRFVPKKLVEKFVKACPTCAGKNRRLPPIHGFPKSSTPSLSSKHISSSEENYVPGDLLDTWHHDSSLSQTASLDCVSAPEPDYRPIGRHRVLSVSEILRDSPPMSNSMSSFASTAGDTYNPSLFIHEWETSAQLTTSAEEDRHLPARHHVFTVAEYLNDSPPCPSSHVAHSASDPLFIPTLVQPSSSGDFQDAEDLPASTNLPFASNAAAHTRTPLPSELPAWDDFFVLCDSGDSSPSAPHEAVAPLSPARSKSRRAHPYKLGGEYYGRPAHYSGSGGVTGGFWDDL